MHPNSRGFFIAASLFFLTVFLHGCGPNIKYIPVTVEGKLALVEPQLIEKAKRPEKRTPANTPLMQAGREWARDRKLSGDEADRSDVLRKYVCGLHGGVVLDKAGKNLCKDLE